MAANFWAMLILDMATPKSEIECLFWMEIWRQSRKEKSRQHALAADVCPALFLLPRRDRACPVSFACGTTADSAPGSVSRSCQQRRGASLRKDQRPPRLEVDRFKAAICDLKLTQSSRARALPRSNVRRAAILARRAAGSPAWLWSSRLRRC